MSVRSFYHGGIMEATLEDTLVERLRGLDVRKVVLFGSHAWGGAGQDSDIDLLVVLDEEETPGDAAERGALHRRVARRLRDVARDIPIDLIVHTRPMHRKFLERDSMFAREIQAQGRVLYENGD